MWYTRTIMILNNHTRSITSLAVDPTEKYLASGDESGVVVLWDLQHGIPINTLSVHESEGKSIYSLAFNLDGTKLVIARPWIVELHNVPELTKFSQHSTSFVTHIRWHSSSEYFMTFTDGVEIREGITGQLLDELRYHQDFIYATGMNAEETLLATGSGFHAPDIALWSLQEKRLVATLPDYDDDHSISYVLRLAFKNSDTIIFEDLLGVFEWKIKANTLAPIFFYVPERYGLSSFTHDGRYFAYQYHEIEKTPQSKPYSTDADRLIAIHIHLVDTDTFSPLDTLNDLPHKVSAMTFDK